MRRRAAPRRAGGARVHRPVRRRRPAHHPGAAGRARRGARGPRSGGQAGPGRGGPPHQAGAPGPAPGGKHHQGDRRPLRHRPLRPGPAGRGLRAWRPGGLSLLSGDERRTGPGRRRRLGRRGLPAAGRPRRPAAPVGAGRLRPARHQGGARRGRRPGARHVRLRHARLRWVGRHHRPRQRLRRRGQADPARRGRHRRRERPDRGGRHRRRHRGPRLRGRRPDRAGRARRARRLPAHHHGREPGRESDRGARPHGARRPPPRAGPSGAASPVRLRAGRRPRRGAGRERRLGARAPGDPGP